jgi:hypothetical protein
VRGEEETIRTGGRYTVNEDGPGFAGGHHAELLSNRHLNRDNTTIRFFLAIARRQLATFHRGLLLQAASGCWQ